MDENEIKKTNCETDGNVIVLRDKKGNCFDFSLLDFIEYKGDQYAVLLPKDYEGKSVAILKVEDVNGDRIADYISVKDDSVVEAVFGIFKK
ncbi:MAG: DUF1292 domain-containing protein, partial [Clostridia bacterium]|nr:DUF1292 domain-containing protein [Clostridia bacterium]